MKNSMFSKGLTVAVILLFLGLGFQPAIATVEPKGEITFYESRRPINTKSVIFEQLPYEPDESWIFRISDSDVGYRVWDEYWEIHHQPICCIRWWGLSLKNSGEWISCEPEGMVFEIIFWDALLGNPVCTHQVAPKAKGTFLYYNGTKMFYWATGLEPSCDCIPDGWLSIQSIEGPDNCRFYWAGSDDGNLYCYHEGAQNPDCDGDCAFQLGGEGCYMWLWDPMIQCDSVDMNFGKVAPGDVVTGQIYVCNVGEFLTGLEWFIDTENVPGWGTWTFSPASGYGVEEDDCVLVEVSCIITNVTGYYNGTIVIYNAEDSTDFCTIDTSVIVPRTRKSTSYHWLIECFPLLERLLTLLLL